VLCALAPDLVLELLSLDAATPLQPIGELALQSGFASGVATWRDVAMAGDQAFVVADPITGQDRLVVVDVADPAAPRAMAEVAEPSEAARQVALSGDVAYVGWPVTAHDVADPANPRLLGRRSVSTDLYGQLAAAKGVAYVAGNTTTAFSGEVTVDGVTMADARAPELGPTQTGLYAGEDWILDFAVDGDRVFTAGNTLRILDLSAPADSALLDEVALPDTTFTHLAVDGPVVYATTQAAQRGLSVLTVDAAGSRRRDGAPTASSSCGHWQWSTRPKTACASSTSPTRAGSRSAASTCRRPANRATRWRAWSQAASPWPGQPPTSPCVAWA
jgi:hypothetical protein